MKEEIIVEATNKSLGRLSSEIAHYLQGKNKPDYDPSKDKKTFVLVKNLDKARFTGKKFEKDYFTKHTGYLGHLKKISLKELWLKDKLKVLKLIVKNMLPKNKLRKSRLSRIKIVND